MITLQNGDILHCRSNGVLGKAIRLASRGKFNHTAIVIIIDGEIFIAEAQNNGVNLKTFDNWQLKYNYDYVVSRYLFGSKEWGKAFRKRALSKIGVTGYDYVSLFVWQPVLQITGKWLGRKGEKAEKRMYCSEFAPYTHNVIDGFKMSPQAFYEYCKDSPLYEFVNEG